MDQKQSEVLAPGDLPVYDTTTELAFESILATVMTTIVAVAPFLGFPLVSSFTKYISAKVIRIAWGPLVMFGAFQIIDAEAKKKADDYKATVEVLGNVLKNPTSTPEQIKEAHEDFKKRLALLIRIKPLS